MTCWNFSEQLLASNFEESVNPKSFKLPASFILKTNHPLENSPEEQCYTNISNILISAASSDNWVSTALKNQTCHIRGQLDLMKCITRQTCSVEGLKRLKERVVALT